MPPGTCTKSHDSRGLASKLAKGLIGQAARRLDLTTITAGYSKVLIPPPVAVVLHLDGGLVPNCLRKG